jgi:hypothetical protein
MLSSKDQVEEGAIGLPRASAAPGAFGCAANRRSIRRRRLYGVGARHVTLRAFRRPSLYLTPPKEVHSVAQYDAVHQSLETNLLHAGRPQPAIEGAVITPVFQTRTI